MDRAEEVNQIRISRLNEYFRLTKDLGLNDGQVSTLCEINERTVRRWITGERVVHRSTLAHLTLLQWLNDSHPNVAADYAQHVSINS